MSDMRNFGAGTEPTPMSEKIRETNFGSQAQFRDTGGFSSFHHTEDADETSSNTAKMIGGAAVVLLLCGAGAYAYMSSSATSKSPVSASSLPSPSAPQAVAANTPPPIQTAPATPPSAPSGSASALANSPYGSAPMSARPAHGKVASAMPAPAAAREDATADKPPVKTAHARIRKEKSQEATENTPGSAGDQSAQQPGNGDRDG